MGKRLQAHLSEEDRQALEQVVKEASDWRARARAKTVQPLGQSLLCCEVAQLQVLNIGKVGQTRRHWRQEGMASNIKLCFSQRRAVLETSLIRLTAISLLRALVSNQPDSMRAEA